MIKLEDVVNDWIVDTFPRRGRVRVREEPNLCGDAFPKIIIDERDCGYILSDCVIFYGLSDDRVIWLDIKFYPTDPKFFDKLETYLNKIMKSGVYLGMGYDT